MGFPTDNIIDQNEALDFTKPVNASIGGGNLLSGMGTINGDELSLPPTDGPQSVPDWTKPLAQGGVGGVASPSLQSDGTIAISSTQGSGMPRDGKNLTVTAGKTPDFTVQSSGTPWGSNSGSNASQTLNTVLQGGGGGGGLDLGNGLSIGGKPSAAANGSGAGVVSLAGIADGGNVYSGGSAPMATNMHALASANAPAAGNQNRAWKDAVPSEQKRNDQRDAASLSDACYDYDGGVKSGKVPDNYEVASVADLSRMGLKMSDFSDDRSNLHSILYRNKTTGRYVLAFRGTDPMSGKDIANDVAQGTGYDAQQYDDAIALARKVDEVMRRTGGIVSYTGHSLGGGLAAVASLATLRPANTFNAAAVSPETLTRNGIEINDANYNKMLINSFYIPGEALSDAQWFSNAGAGDDIRTRSLGLLDPVGVAQGKRIPIDPMSAWYHPLDKHSIDQFTRSMK